MQALASSAGNRCRPGYMTLRKRRKLVNYSCRQEGVKITAWARFPKRRECEGFDVRVR
jgi:hypothetical protein